MSTVLYTYDTLPEIGAIRLLQLNEGADGDVSGSLRTFSLESAPPFYALSYCWGSKLISGFLTIDGKLLNVSTGVIEALERVCKPTGVLKELDPPLRYVWIDQVCINQNNVHERNHQVSNMRSVYGTSVRTIVWLGPDHGLASAAFAVCRRIENIALQDMPKVDGRRSFSHHYAFSEEKHRQLRLPDFHHRNWQALQALFTRPWFHRLWIFQEVILSAADPIVLYGKSHCAWSTLSWAGYWLLRNDYARMNLIPSAVWAIEAMVKVDIELQPWDLGALLVATQHHFMASDPRDKVFGLLGILHEGMGSIPFSKATLFSADYHLNAIEVFRDATRFIINSTRNLAILSLPMCQVKNIWDPYRSYGRQAYWGDRSSWIPNLDDSVHAHKFVHAVIRHPDTKNGLGYSYYSIGYKLGLNASRGLPVRLLEGDCPNSLCLSGFQVDRVAKCFEVNTFKWRRPYKLRSWPQKLLMRDDNGWILSIGRPVRHKLFRFHLQSRLSRLANTSILRMWEATFRYGRYTKTLQAVNACMNATTRGLDFRQTSRQDEALSDFCRMLNEMRRERGRRKLSPGLKAAYKEMEEYVRVTRFSHQPVNTRTTAERSEHWCNLRRFFVTEQGRVGIGTPGMQKGDMVCVLFGAGVPHILRPYGSQWLFVGDAYIYELMDGEAIDMWKRGELCEERFDIC